MIRKILIMGLPGAGKTTLAEKLVFLIKSKWLNADAVRKEVNDWDFSEEGRKRQAMRMASKAEEFVKSGQSVVVDFVCPTPELRKLFNPDFTIWVDTIKLSRFEDTNKIFIEPKNFDIRVTEQNAELWAQKIAKKLETN